MQGVQQQQGFLPHLSSPLQLARDSSLPLDSRLSILPSSLEVTLQLSQHLIRSILQPRREAHTQHNMSGTRGRHWQAAVVASEHWQLDSGQVECEALTCE